MRKLFAKQARREPHYSGGDHAGNGQNERPLAPFFRMWAKQLARLRPAMA